MSQVIPESRLFPFGKNIVAIRSKAEEKTSSGLYIPDNAKDKPQEGYIVWVSSLIDSGLKRGDNILFGKYSGTEVTVDDQELLLLREEEVLGVLVPKESV